ncbi:hypothetical protein DRQ09_05470 [candidate division KSB1 bacterium]|nr:MAG: hypothetical protein DRQ09_05470 [candidate division KSB1 bacterium]
MEDFKSLGKSFFCFFLLTILSVSLYPFKDVEAESILYFSPDSAYISFSDTTFNFGDVIYNTQAYYKYFYVYNNGNDTLFINRIELPASSDSVSFSIWYYNTIVHKDTILAGRYKRWRIHFFPYEKKTYMDTIRIHSNAVNDSIKNLYITGYADPGDISVMTDEYDFGNIKVGTSVWEYFIIFNDGSSNLTITDININDTAFSVDDTSFVIDPSISVSRSVILTFSPYQVREFIDTMRILSSDIDEPETRVILRGEGSIPVLSTTLETLNFGSKNINTVGIYKLPVKNEGGYDLNIYDIDWSDTSAFTLTDTSEVITPGENSSIFVNFMPSEEKEYRDTLRIYSNNYSDTITYLYLEGTGTAPDIENQSYNIDFGNISLYNEKTDSIIIRNTGSGNLTLSGFSHIQADSIFNFDNSSKTISPGDSLIFSVLFTPYEKDTILDTITIETNLINGDTVYIYLSGVGTAPLISINNVSVEFDSVVPPSTETIQDTIINNGNSVLTLNNVTVGGTAFETDLTPGTEINSGDFLVFTITFNPEFGQVYNDSIIITTNDPDNPEIIIHLSGTGKAAELSTSSLSLNFGDTSTGNTIYDSLIIYNNGTINLNVTDINLAKIERGSQHTIFEDLPVYNAFSISDTTVVIAPQDSYCLHLSFTPQYEMGYFDTLIIVSNTNSTVNSRIALTGNSSKNFYPEILTIPDTTVLEDQLYTYNIYAYDFDGDRVVYTLTSAPSDMTLDTISGSIQWTPSDADADSIHSIIIYASDGKTGIDSQKFSIRVIEVNGAPQVLSTPDTIAYLDSLYSFQLNVFDEENDSLIYRFLSAPFYPSPMIIDENGLITWIPVATGTYNIILQIRDVRGAVTTLSFKIYVIELNYPPEFASIPDTSIYEDSLFEKVLIATDKNNDELIFSLVNSPSNMTIDSLTGKIEWTPENDDVGKYSIVISVTDNKGGYDTTNFNINVLNTNDPPVISSISDTTIYTEVEFYLIVTAVDVDSGDTFYFYDNTELFDIDSLSGEIRFTPSLSDTGVYPVMIKVSDGESTDSTEFTITIAHINLPPVVYLPEDTFFYEDDTLKIYLNRFVTDPDNSADELIWSLNSGDNISGIVEDSIAYIFSTLNWNGTEELTFIVQDPQSLADTAIVKFTVYEVNDIPVILEPERSLSFNEDETLSVDISNWATDVEDNIHNLKWEFSSDTIIHISIDDNLKAYFIPAPNWYGRDTVNFSVTDSDSAKATGKLYINVKSVNDPPVITYITPENDTTITEDDSLIFEVEFTDIDNDTVSVFWFVDNILKSNDIQFIFHNYFAGKLQVEVKLIVTDNVDSTINLWKIYCKSTTDINPDKNIPSKWELFQNFPNPFNSITTIKFSVPHSSRVSLKIYNLQGRLIKNLVNSTLLPGKYSVIWDGRNSYGITTATGIYIIKLQGNDFVSTRKILFLK